jgi:hypothetical protein
MMAHLQLAAACEGGGRRRDNVKRRLTIHLWLALTHKGGGGGGVNSVKITSSLLYQCRNMIELPPAHACMQGRWRR